MADQQTKSARLARILDLVGRWMEEYGPESKAERAFGPQVISVGHVYAAIIDGEDHPPFAAWPEYEGSLAAVCAERDEMRARLAAVEALLSRQATFPEFQEHVPKSEIATALYPPVMPGKDG